MERQAGAKLVQARVRARGYVQGVFFRASLRDRAEWERVSGWVRNTADGSVEAMLAGRLEAVERLIEWCREGPSGARVEGVDVTWEPEVTESGAFRVRG